MVEEAEPTHSYSRVGASSPGNANDLPPNASREPSPNAGQGNTEIDFAMFEATDMEIDLDMFKAVTIEMQAAFIPGPTHRARLSEPAPSTRPRASPHPSTPRKRQSRQTDGGGVVDEASQPFKLGSRPTPSSFNHTAPHAEQVNGDGQSHRRSTSATPRPGQGSPLLEEDDEDVLPTESVLNPESDLSADDEDEEDQDEDILPPESQLHPFSDVEEEMDDDEDDDDDDDGLPGPSQLNPETMEDASEEDEDDTLLAAARDESSSDDEHSSDGGDEDEDDGDDVLPSLGQLEPQSDEHDSEDVDGTPRATRTQQEVPNNGDLPPFESQSHSFDHGHDEAEIENSSGHVDEEDDDLLPSETQLNGVEQEDDDEDIQDEEHDHQAPTTAAANGLASPVPAPSRPTSHRALVNRSTRREEEIRFATPDPEDILDVERQPHSTPRRSRGITNRTPPGPRRVSAHKATQKKRTPTNQTRHGVRTESPDVLLPYVTQQDMDDQYQPNELSEDDSANNHEHEQDASVRDPTPDPDDRLMVDFDRQPLVEDPRFVIPPDFIAPRSVLHGRTRDNKSDYGRLSGKRKWTQFEGDLLYRSVQKVPLSQANPCRAVAYVHGEFGWETRRLRHFNVQHMKDKMRVIVATRVNAQVPVVGRARAYLPPNHPDRRKFNLEMRRWQLDQDEERERLRQEEELRLAEESQNDEVSSNEGDDEPESDYPDKDRGSGGNPRPAGHDNSATDSDSADQQTLRRLDGSSDSESDRPASPPQPLTSRQQARRPMTSARRRGRQHEGQGPASQRRVSWRVPPEYLEDEDEGSNVSTQLRAELTSDCH